LFLHKRKLLFVLVMVVVLVLVAGCGGKEPAKQADEEKKAEEQKSAKTPKVEVIKIGAIHPLTGGLAYEGTQIRNALELALDEVNAAGGIKSLGGAKLELIDGDSEASPEKAVSEVKRLVREGAVVLTGSYTSSSTYPATQEAEKLKTPFVITIAAAPNIMDRGFKYSFRIQPNAEIFSQDFIDYLKAIKAPETKTAAIIHEDSLFGTSIADYVEEHIGEAGVELVARVPYPASTPDLSSEITKLAAAKPDIIIGVGYYRDEALMLKTLKEQKVESQAVIGIANGAFSDPKLIDDLGETAELVLDVNYHINPKSELAKKVAAKYKEKYGNPISSHALYGYTAGQVIADALERAASTDKEKIREALAQTNITEHILPHGPIQFGADGENINAAAVMTQIQDGKHVVVFPKEYAEADLIFPVNN